MFPPLGCVPGLRRGQMWEPLRWCPRGLAGSGPEWALQAPGTRLSCAQRGRRLAPGRCPGAGLLLPALRPPLLASSGFLSPTREAAPGLLSLALAALCGPLLSPKPPILAAETPSFIPAEYRPNPLSLVHSLQGSGQNECTGPLKKCQDSQDN